MSGVEHMVEVCQRRRCGFTIREFSRGCVTRCVAC